MASLLNPRFVPRLARELCKGARVGSSEFVYSQPSLLHQHRYGPGTTPFYPLRHDQHSRRFHIVSPQLRDRRDVPEVRRHREDLRSFDILSDIPVPATSVDICISDGFQLDNGTKILDGNGVLLAGGESFVWRPWIAKGTKVLANPKGQFDLPNEAFGLFSLLWPRPGKFRPNANTLSLLVPI
jgi:NADH dehydrogenase [ubiquinone] 1 alpha subcomplex assembly factor 3